MFPVEESEREKKGQAAGTQAAPSPIGARWAAAEPMGPSFESCIPFYIAPN